MTKTRTYRRVATLFIAATPLLSSLALAQGKKEFNYSVGSKAVISITNNCGSVIVKPSGNRQVLVSIVSHSDASTFMNEQHGKRIELRADCSPPKADLIDYTTLVPVTAFVVVRSVDGPVHAQGLRGDVIVETVGGSVEASDITGTHLHVRTLGGKISLSSVSGSHVDIHSLRGDVNIQNVSDSFLEVRSGDGRITYDGDPGKAGEYSLSSHSGDLEVSVPASASVEIESRSMKGESGQDVPNTRAALGDTHQSLLVKPGIVHASRFVLRSFSGKIRVKRP
jgi:DUF4097 and DUF4098 domain-containing protein YvlB